MKKETFLAILECSQNKMALGYHAVVDTIENRYACKTIHITSPNGDKLSYVVTLTSHDGRETFIEYDKITAFSLHKEKENE